MQVKSNAIVLHALKFGDSQLIVDLLTEQMGRMSFICHIPVSKKAKIKKQFFQPLNLLSIEFDYRQNARLQHFKDIRMAEPFADIPFNARKLSICLFLSEFLTYATRDEQQNAPLYKYVESSILWLDNSQHSFANFHLVFMMRLSRFIGFFPNLEHYSVGDFFDLRSGEFCQIPPLHTDFIHPDEASKIVLLMRMNYESMHLFKMSREERNRCIELIINYYRLHIPNFPELKSLSILQELFV
jgi:DNA repair protein RecO (recombination protein O)